eukprot:scaffold1033_cov408-Prasinococcus_capsulatus_cf.AAC.22
MTVTGTGGLGPLPGRGGGHRRVSYWVAVDLCPWAYLPLGGPPTNSLTCVWYKLSCHRTAHDSHR